MYYNYCERIFLIIHVKMSFSGVYIFCLSFPNQFVFKYNFLNFFLFTKIILNLHDANFCLNKMQSSCSIMNQLKRTALFIEANCNIFSSVMYPRHCISRAAGMQTLQQSTTDVSCVIIASCCL